MLVARPLGTTNKATAVCDTSDQVGDLVHVDGDKIGAEYHVTRADATQFIGVPALAVIVAKLSSTLCVIQFEGDVLGIYSGLTAGRNYFLGTDSRPALLPPVPSLGGRAYCQIVGVAVDANILRLKPMEQINVRVS